MRWETSEKIIREVVHSIRLRDERARGRSWCWADMDQGRREAVVGDLLEVLTKVERDDLLIDAMEGQTLELYRITTFNPLRRRIAKTLTPWFEQIIEGRVNARIAA